MSKTRRALLALVLLATLCCVSVPQGWAANPREQDAFMDAFIASVTVAKDPAPEVTAAPSGPLDWRQLYDPADYEACVSPDRANDLRGAKIRAEGRLTAINEGNGMREWIVRQADGKEWSVVMQSEVGADLGVGADLTCYGIYLGLSAKPTVNLLRYEVMYSTRLEGEEVASIYEGMSFEEIHRYLTE